MRAATLAAVLAVGGGTRSNIVRTITIDRKTYEYDALIRLSAEVVKRKKKLSKKYYGASHVLSKEEAESVFERGCNQLIVGSGHDPLVAGSRSVFRNERLQSIVASRCGFNKSMPRTSPFSRHLLKRKGAAATARL